MIMLESVDNSIDVVIYDILQKFEQVRIYDYDQLLDKFHVKHSNVAK